MKFIEKTCFTRTFALIVIVQSMFPVKIALVYIFTLFAALKRFLSCKRDNSVQTVMIFGTTFFLWPNLVLNVFLR